MIAGRISWPGSITNLRRHVRLLRPLLAPVDPADRLSYPLGDQGQCDLWFPVVKIPLSDGSVVNPAYVGDGFLGVTVRYRVDVAFPDDRGFDCGRLGTVERFRWCPCPTRLG